MPNPAHRWGWVSVDGQKEDGEIPISCTPEQVSLIPCLCNIPRVWLHVSPGGCTAWWGCAQAALSGMIKTDSGFPESILIQNEICEPEGGEHNTSVFVHHLNGPLELLCGLVRPEELML